MTHKPILYVNRITNLSDARYCAGMGVDMLGFVIDPSHTDYVSPGRYQEMVGWISGPARVLEIMSPIDMKELTEAYKPELIHTNLATAKRSPFGDLPLMIEVAHLEYSRTIAEVKALRNVRYIIVNGFTEGNDAMEFHGYEVLLSIENSTKSAIGILARSGAAGLALRGTAEAVPGLKDYDHLSKILEELDNA